MMARLMRLPGWAHALGLVLLCGAIGLPMLGANGFVDTEGHRVAPAWEMLRTGEVAWRGDLRMFTTPFLTKPPATPLAIAASGALFGQSEWSARLPSVLWFTLGVLLTWGVGVRLFGRVGGLASGLAHALSPWLWAPARSAEIESLFVLGTQASCLGIVGLVLASRGPDGSGVGGWRSRVLWALAIGLGTFVSLYSKGPAGVPCVAGVLLASVVCCRSVRVLWRPELLAGLVGAVGGFVLVYWPAWAARREAAAMTEAVDKFLWSDVDPVGLVRFPVAAFVSALPAGLALLFPWGPDARREALAAADGDRVAHDAARLLALGWLCSIGVFVCFGVTNSRYAMPAVVFATLLVGYVARGVVTAGPDGFGRSRRLVARLCCLGHPAVLCVVLLIGAGVFVVVEEGRRARHTGRDAGREIAAMLPSASTVWMVDAITARPELGLELERAGHTVVWARGAFGAGSQVPVATVVVLRTDGASDERGLAGVWAESDSVETLGAVRVRDYAFTAFTIVRVGPSLGR